MLVAGGGALGGVFVGRGDVDVAVGGSPGATVDVGVSAGAMVGVDVGVSPPGVGGGRVGVGVSPIASVDSSVGSSIGSSVGSSVGSFVGSSVGSSVGSVVGVNVGVSVGVGIGVRVSVAVGVSVTTGGHTQHGVLQLFTIIGRLSECVGSGVRTTPKAADAIAFPIREPAIAKKMTIRTKDQPLHFISLFS